MLARPLHHSRHSLTSALHYHLTGSASRVVFSAWQRTSSTSTTLISPTTSFSQTEPLAHNMRTCLDCTTPVYGNRLRCDVCRVIADKESKSASQIRTRALLKTPKKCARCDVVLVGAGGRAIWCKPCKKAVESERRKAVKEQARTIPLSGRSCERCGDAFDAKRDDSRLCPLCMKRRARSGSTKLEGRTCGNCGTTFDAVSGNQKVCASCKPAVDAERYMVKNAERYSPHVDKPCYFCGGLFSTNSEKHKFCSEECRWKSKLKRLRENRPQRVVQCSNCLRRFVPTHSAQRLCSRECQIATRNSIAKQKYLDKATADRWFRTMRGIGFIKMGVEAIQRDAALPPIPVKEKRGRGKYDRKTAVFPEKECRICNSKFTPKGNRAQTCQGCKPIVRSANRVRSYQNSGKNLSKKGRTCHNCGSTFDATAGSQKYCRPECVLPSKGYLEKHVPLAGRVCEGCGKMFDARAGSQRFCGDPCTYLKY